MGNVDSKMKTKKHVSRNKYQKSTQNDNAQISNKDEKDTSHRESTEQKSETTIKTNSDSTPAHLTTDHKTVENKDEKDTSHRESTEQKSETIIKTNSDSKPAHLTTDHKTVENKDSEESHHSALEHIDRENSDYSTEEEQDGKKSRDREDKYEYDEYTNDSGKKTNYKNSSVLYHETGKQRQEHSKTTPKTSENEQDSDEDFSPDIMDKIHKTTVMAENKKIMYEKKIQKISRIIHSLKRVEESHDHR